MLNIVGYAPGGRSYPLVFPIDISEKGIKTTKGHKPVPKESLVLRTSLAIDKKEGYKIVEDYILVADFSKLKIDPNAKITGKNICIPGVIGYDLVETLTYKDTMKEWPKLKDDKPSTKSQYLISRMKVYDNNIKTIRWDSRDSEEESTDLH